MRKLIIALIAACFVFAASSAMAIMIAHPGFELVISNNQNTNTPHFTLTNTGSLDIEYFKMTIGDTSYNFDFVNDVAPGSVSYTLITPEYYVNGGQRPDTQEFSFTDFAPGWSMEWIADVDIDNSNTVEDYRTIFFNNGDDPNSVVTVTFEGGRQLEGVWPDTTDTDFFTMSINTPIPAAVWLLGSGLVGLLGLRRKMPR